MSYEPLHHKYRPKTFAELVGQEAIATTLTNAINALKIAPAYLFTGPRGTGKTSSARILAKSLNCLASEKPTPQPCGKCDACQGISKGATLDVIEIDAASNTGVDNIREIIERAQFAPVQCRYKVYVIDECHMLSTQAFNALLKTLEEPPKHVVFVLATTDPQRVLPTIISRCQRFDFRRIPMDAMVEHLSDIAVRENIQITQEAVTLVAQVAQGGLRDAESLLDQLGLLTGEVTPEKVWDLVGSVSEQDLLNLLKAIVSDDSESVIDATRKILDRGREPLIILQNLASFYRDLLIAKTAPNRNDLASCTQTMWGILLEVAQHLQVSSILHGQQHLRTAEVQIKNTTQPRLWLEVTLLGLLPSATAIQSNINNQQSVPKFTSISAKTTTNPPTQSDTASPTPAFVQNTHTITPTQQTPANTASPTPTVVQNTHTITPTQPTQPDTASPTPAVAQNTHAITPTQQTQPDSASSAPTVAQNTHAITPTQQTPPTTPTIPSDPSPPQATPQANVNQIWQQVLANLIPVPRRELLRQMCYLVDFDGTVARVAVKQAWYKRVKQDEPKITAAFQATFNKQVKVNLEVASSAPPAKSNPNITHTATNQIPQPQQSTQPQQIPSPAPVTTSPQVSPQPAYTPKQQPQVAAQSPQVQPSFSTPKTTTPQVTPPPPQPNPIIESLETDEVIKAAKRLAEALNGEIIQLGEENTEISDESFDSSELQEVEDDDVEF